MQIILACFFMVLMGIILNQLIKSVNNGNNEAALIFASLEGILTIMVTFIFGYYFPKRTINALPEGNDDQSKLE